MSIVIGRVANKFWTNADWDCPNGFPIYEEQQELKFDTPNMNDFMSGTIYLEGDSWNHCKYEGAYYNLYIVHLVSHRKKRYLYRLERDLWMDILIHRPKVVGDLSNSNNDELLEANLNRTISALDNPARVITVNFGNIDFDGTQGFTFRESKKELKQIVLSKDNFNRFIAAAAGRGFTDGKDVNKKIYAGTDSYYSGLKDGANDATFIFSYLEPSVTTRGGKHLLREKINEFVRSIEKDKGKDLKISKLNSESFKTSPINGNYCITHKVDGISTTQESVRLKEIDLSGLTDIVALKHYDLSEGEPAHVLGKGSKSGLFEEVDNKIHPSSFLAKIRRKAYIPINASSENAPTAPSTFGSFRENSFNWNKAKDPQIVSGAAGGRQGKFNLWFLDNVNFYVTYDGWNPGIEYSTVESTVIAVSTFYIGGASAQDRQFFSGMIQRFRANSYFDVPVPWIAGYSPFGKLKDPVVPFGFLIYGIQRRYSEGKRFEYIGAETKRDFYYGSGIKGKLLEKYSQEGEGWSKIDSKLASIQPTEQFTKFYLDNYNFSWLCFFPATKYNGWQDPYLNTDGGGTGKHTPKTYYVGEIVSRDIHDINGNLRKANPYNDTRYPKERARVDGNLTTFLNRTRLDLPEGLVIEKGDYFFSDQDYEIVEYPPSVSDTRLKKIADDTNLKPYHVGNYTIFNRLTPYLFMVEDMMEIKGGKLFADKAGEKLVVLCTTNAGGMEVRTLETFEKELSISAADDEIVQDVDGSTKRNTRFTLMKKLLGDFVGADFKGLTEAHENQIIHAFYKVHGYKTKINEGVAHWIGFDESDFAAESNTQQLFDLVGTDGYAFLAKGKISLICKKTSLFEPQKGQSGRLLHEENKDLNLSLIEKISQKVRFQFFGVPYYLRGRSSFSDRDRIDFKVETMQPTELQTNFDQYFISLDTEFDRVYYENASIAKRQTKGLSVADSVQLEKLNLDMAKAQYSYQIDSDKYKIAVDRFNENIKRAETDLYHSRLASWMNLGAAGGAGAFGTGIAMKYRQGRQFVTTVGKGFADNPNQPVEKLNRETGEGEDYGFTQTPVSVKKITTIPGKTPNIMAGLVSAAVFKTSKLIMDHAFRFPEEARRIGVEKQIGAANLALQSLALNTKFIEKQLDVQLAINQKTNIYSNPIINEREIMESFMEKDEGHGKKLKPAHLVCFVPSEEQLVALREFKDQYGVMCDIPNVVTHFYEGMPPDVIRYRNLDDDAISGLPNEGMRAFLKSHLLAGVKIRKVTREVYEILDADGYREKILRLNSDLLDKADEVKVLEGRINTIVEETKAECAVEASELQKKITNLENEVNEVNRRLREKLEECKKAGEDDERNKEELHKLKVEKEELEQKLADERRRAINEKDEINRLKKKDEERTELVNKLQEEFNKIQVNLPKVVQELEECKKGEDSRQACALISEIFIDPYEFDLKSRENGGDAFMDLIFELATALRGEGRSRIDQKLGNMEQMRPLLEKLEELKNVPIVDKAIDVMQETGGNKYQDGIKSGGEKNGDIRNVIEKMNQIKLMETPSALHQVKALLDELNFVCYKLIGISHEMVTASQDIQFFLKHVYPGKSLELYQEIFGDYNHAIIRKTYPIACKPGGPFEGVNVSRLLTEAKKGIKLRLEIFDQPSPGQEEEGPKQEEGGSQPSQPEEAKQEEKPQATRRIRFYGMPLDAISGPYECSCNMAEFFEADAFASVQDKYFRKYNSNVYDHSVFGAALESYYWRYLKMSKGTSDGFGASNRDGTGSSRQNGGNKYKLAHIGLRIGRTGVSNRYINVANFKDGRFRRIAENVKILLQRREEITVDEDYYSKVRSGEIRISIRANSVDRSFGFSADTVEIPLDTIEQMDSRNLLKEFIKFLYIFDRNKLEIVDGAYDYSDGWRVAQAYYSSGANIEAHYKNVGATNNDRKDRFAIGFIYSDAPVLFRSKEGVWVYEDEKGTRGFLQGQTRPSDAVAGLIPASPRFKIIKFLRYFYFVSTGKYTNNHHPWLVSEGGHDAVGDFLRALEAVANY